MNRDDLLKKCADRGVADETSVATVSHLFYVYLLSALQKGQRVEVPDFGTFGTRVVGVKKARKMPYFEVERVFADKVNERYRNLKYLVVGKYDLLPVFGEEEYKGKEAPYDRITEEVGREAVIDTHHDVTLEEYERAATDVKKTVPSKEKKLMPTLNLREEGMEEEKPFDETEPTVGAPPPTLRPLPSGGGRGLSPVWQILLAVIVLGAITFALNYFGVIHLWGKKEKAMVPTTMEPPAVTVPEPVETKPVETPTPVPVEKPAPPTKLPPSGVGDFTVQVSSWMSMSKATEQVQRLAGAGFDAFVEDAVVAGERWHRVRVGRYASQKEAAAAAAKLQDMLDNGGAWVARIGAK
jgi:septal ring-binding cell division protein DamX/nucleoid DNA-binding protein